MIETKINKKELPQIKRAVQRSPYWSLSQHTLLVGILPKLKSILYIRIFSRFQRNTQIGTILENKKELSAKIPVINLFPWKAAPEL